MKKLMKALHWLAATPLVLLLLFEEWGWEPLAALFAKLARLPLWAALERQIARLSTWAALVLLVLPALILFPLKLLALALFAKGQAAVGLAVLLGAKLVGTAVFARLFMLTQPALMRLAWFARWYPRWKAWKDHWMQRVRASAPWRAARAIRLRVTRLVKRQTRSR